MKQKLTFNIVELKGAEVLANCDTSFFCENLLEKL